MSIKWRDPDPFDADLAEIAMLAQRMIDTCERIIDAVDERSAVHSWNAELNSQLEMLARAHQELNR